MFMVLWLLSCLVSDSLPSQPVRVRMVVRIRLARFGHKNRPFYRIVAIDSRKARQGRHIELLGTYNPLQSRDGAKEIRLKTDRVKYWLSEGAQPSETMARLLGLAGVLPMPPIRYQPTKSTPRAEREYHTSALVSGAWHTDALTSGPRFKLGLSPSATLL